jgi:hypothetical protein
MPKIWSRPQRSRIITPLWETKGGKLSRGSKVRVLPGALYLNKRRLLITVAFAFIVFIWYGAFDYQNERRKLAFSSQVEGFEKILANGVIQKLYTSVLTSLPEKKMQMTDSLNLEQGYVLLFEFIRP